ncbi:bifunctional isocitrate dehydrogenase kinase/phosphatase [Lunatibacter salilacus]|uniref:bifunctional isocitrate dehydrogenase kinase/phosphatase n=1 Tax=Lunatibacter salilacus TaxID=2483804 RepID=UPI00131D5B5A|nr:bifunctional isocitrate dehydrogenase kinase/phosphatase [Lunatibacter salilacus]
MFHKINLRQFCKLAGPVFFIGVLIACSGRVEEGKSEAGGPNPEATSEALLERGLKILQPWTSHWADWGMPDALSSFRQIADLNLELLERPEVNPIKEGEHPLATFQFQHPDAIGTVDIYHYKVHIDDASRVSFEPDAEVIFYRQNGMRERLLFIGPSGLFEDAVWIDAIHLLVVGYFENEAGFSPMAWLLDIENSSYLLYESEFVVSNYDRFGYLKKKLSALNLGP